MDSVIGFMDYTISNINIRDSVVHSELLHNDLHRHLADKLVQPQNS